MSAAAMIVTVTKAVAPYIVTINDGTSTSTVTLTATSHNAAVNEAIRLHRIDHVIPDPTSVSVALMP